MTEERPYKVFKIKEGVAIDHIPAGKALRVVSVLGLDRDLGEGIITLGMNLESKKMEKKDVVKIENKKLTKDDLNKIALIGPRASVNIIHDGHVVEKVDIEIPDEFHNLVKCPNPKCITRNDDLDTLFFTKARDPLRLKCHYCERVFDREDVDLL
ncbi:aspartate carbamoyltransferase regulatory subunit [Thermoproteota archaeon]